MKKLPKTATKKQIDIPQTISKAVFAYIKNSKGLSTPTRQDIADLTGLSIRTIDRYYKDIKFQPSDLPQRALTPIVVNNLLAQTSKSTQAVKLWFQLMEGWRENADVDTSDGTLKINHTIVTRTETTNPSLDFTDNGD